MEAETRRKIAERRERRARGEHVPNGSPERALPKKHANLHEARRQGLDPTYWKRSLARTRRVVRRERVLAVVPSLRGFRRDRRPPGGRPAGRPRRPSSRAGPSDDDGPLPRPPLERHPHYGLVNRPLARFLRGRP